MDLFDFRMYRVKYSLGKSKDVHELIIVCPNIVAARQETMKRHRNGQLYPTMFSAYQDLKIKAIDDVS